MARSQSLRPLPDIDTQLVAGQVDDHASRVVHAAAEIDVAQRLRVVAAAFGKCRGRWRGRRGGRHRIERNQQGTTLHLGTVGRGLVEVQDHARAITGLDHIGSAEVASVDLDRVALQPADHVRKVQRDARRRLHRESGRHGRQRLRQIDAHDLDAALHGTGDRLDARLGMRTGHRAQGHPAYRG